MAARKSPLSFSSSRFVRIGRRMTRKDPNIFLVLNQVRKQKALYDPAKHDWFRLFVERRATW